MAADGDSMHKFVSAHTDEYKMCAGFILLTSSAKVSSLFRTDHGFFWQIKKAAEDTGYIFLPVKEEEDGLQVKKARQ